MINTQTQQLESNSDDICDVCGGKKSMIVELFGKKSKVKCACKCETAEYERQKELDKQKERQLKLDKLKAFSLMDKKFESCTFENWKMDKVNEKMYKLGKNYCAEWQDMKKENVGFLFYGPPGPGKTYLSFCIANELMNKLVPVIAISSIGLLNRIKQTYSSYGQDGEVGVINALGNASLLIIDDLGAESSTDWANEKMYEIIDSRYRSGLPLIVSTNLTLEQLRTRMSGRDGTDRTYDRLLEMCQPVKIEGPSRRLEVAKNKTEILKKLMA